MRRAAFTLIELLVVILIIALLIALLFPVLRAARNRAATQVCRAQVREIGTGIQLYYDDNRKWPPGSNLPSVIPGSVYLPDIIGRYLGEQNRIFACPADTPGFSDRDPPNAGRSYYESERSSYWYAGFWPVVEEYEPFHD